MPQHPRDSIEDIASPGRSFPVWRVISILVAAGVTGWIGWVVYIEFFGLDATTERTRELLWSKKLDRFELRDATFEQSVETFREALKKAGISERKVQVRVISPNKPAKRVQNPLIPDVDQPAQERMNLSLSGVSAMEAGKYVAIFFDRELSIYGREAQIHPEGEKPLFRRTFQINPGFVTARGSLEADGSYDIEEVLKTNGVPFREGAWATVDPTSGKLEVCLPQSEIDLVEVMFTSYERPLTWQERILYRLGFYP